MRRTDYPMKKLHRLDHVNITKKQKPYSLPEGLEWAVLTFDNFDEIINFSSTYVYTKMLFSGAFNTPNIKQSLYMVSNMGCHLCQNSTKTPYL